MAELNFFYTSSPQIYPVVYMAVTKEPVKKLTLGECIEQAVCNLYPDKVDLSTVLKRKNARDLIDKVMDERDPEAIGVLNNCLADLAEVVCTDYTGGDKEKEAKALGYLEDVRISGTSAELLVLTSFLSARGGDALLLILGTASTDVG